MASQTSLPMASIDDVHPGTAGEFVHPRGDILCARIDDMIAAAGLGDCELVVAADRADHGGAKRLCPLAEQRAHAARRGVDQHRVARPHAVALAQQVLGGHAAQERAGDILRLDAGGHRYQRVRRDDAFLRIGPEGEQVAGRIARLERGHAGADRLDDARAVEADDGGQFGFEEILAFAQHGIGEMQRHAFLVEQDLAGARCTDLVVLDAEHVSAAIGVNANNLGHDNSL